MEYWEAWLKNKNPSDIRKTKNNKKLKFKAFYRTMSGRELIVSQVQCPAMTDGCFACGTAVIAILCPRERPSLMRLHVDMPTASTTILPPNRCTGRQQCLRGALGDVKLANCKPRVDVLLRESVTIQRVVGTCFRWHLGLREVRCLCNRIRHDFKDC